jgi:hypothetical protein
MARLLDATPGLAVVQQVVEGTFIPPAFRLMGLRGALALAPG